jgi:hypothetical protein
MPVLKPSPILRAQRTAIAARILELQELLYGEGAGSAMAKSVKVPTRTWYCYLAGQKIPASAILAVMHVHGVEAIWLLRGTGPIFREGTRGSARAAFRTISELLPLALEQAQVDLDRNRRSG